MSSTRFYIQYKKKKTQIDKLNGSMTRIQGNRKYIALADILLWYVMVKNIQKYIKQYILYLSKSDNN